MGWINRYAVMIIAWSLSLKGGFQRSEESNMSHLKNSPHLMTVQEHVQIRASCASSRFYDASYEAWSQQARFQMVYLNGGLCEFLRLFPPTPFNHKSPLQPDILPSGHKVEQDTEIILSMYSMGMKSVWGEDCMKFKPEKWVAKSGGIKHAPTYKFTSFSAGLRLCVGKNTSLSQLKIVSTTIIYHYHIDLVERHPVLPATSMALQMKRGLKVRSTKRSENNN